MERTKKNTTKTGRLIIALAVLCVAGAGLGVGIAAYSYRLSETVREKFRAGGWALPATIYARPFELYPGKPVQGDALARELELIRYALVENPNDPRTYRRRGDVFDIATGGFQFDDGWLEGAKYRITFADNRIEHVFDESGNLVRDPVRLEPAVIGHFSADHYEDRIPISVDEAPDLLIDTLIQVEDRNFYDHQGISISGVFRAMFANINAGRTVQGGSTLTQQLIKNLFHVRKKSYKRKLDEMIMACFLERYRSKREILEAYINEVYMGQDGKRAIHGFGLAARFYFNRSVENIKADETALLVGILKGPSFYDPFRFPERARKRRNTVLSVMRRANLINREVYDQAIQRPVITDPPGKNTAEIFPAYMDLVKRRLSDSYQEEELKTGGLRIFTHFDPQIQAALETAITETLADIELVKELSKGGLETGAVVTDTADGAVLALAGGRNAGVYGYNRALDAHRAIGSLIKPALYLTALSMPEKYNLMTFIDDSPVEIKTRSGKTWRPKNYDHVSHGKVPLYIALANSYNQAAVRLGLDIGVKEVLSTLKALGYKEESPAYPSALLGSVSMSVLDAAQIYQTLAAGGFYTPVRAIRSVHSPQGKVPARFSEVAKQVVNPNYVYLLNKALQLVVTEGTASESGRLMNKNLKTAGKTGTTNDYRDSWFAGFTGNRAAVVWVGRDDNEPCGLSGSDGALRIWSDLFNRISAEPLMIHQPELITWAAVDRNNGKIVDPLCESAVSVPFIMGFAPTESGPCSEEAEKSLFKWLQDIFR